jgi:hypothetical protein
MSGAGVLRLSFAADTRQKTPLRPRALDAQDDTLKNVTIATRTTGFNAEGTRC